MREPKHYTFQCLLLLALLLFANRLDQPLRLTGSFQVALESRPPHGGKPPAARVKPAR